jgi:hypothetical protein
MVNCFGPAQYAPFGTITALDMTSTSPINFKLPYPCCGAIQ